MGAGAGGASGLPLFAVAAGEAFARRLAETMLAEAPTPEALGRELLVLPGRRAVADVTRAFLEASGGRPLVLPRMVAAADLEAAGALDPLLPEAELALAPAMGARERLLALADCLAGAGLAEGSRALALAEELLAALDELAIEGIPLARLEEAAESAATTLWERNRRILAHLARHWPALAEGSGRLDPVLRRERVLSRIARHWQEDRPDRAVTLAGFSAAPPAVRALHAAALRLPRGRVVLAGFDPGLGREGWARLRALAADPARRREAELHPQFGLLLILEACSADPADVRPFGESAFACHPRLALARAATLPAAFLPPHPTGRAPPAAEPAPAATAEAAPLAAKGWLVVEAETLGEEALAVALAMREALETPGRTAALVTPDRALARRVAAELERFGLAVDDSAGQPLRLSAHGRLIAALAEAAATRFAPVPLLTLLGHPMVSDWREPNAADRWRRAARLLDRLLRGVRPPPGLAAITQRIAGATPDVAHADECDLLSRWWADEAAPALGPLEPLFAAGQAPIGPLAAALAEAATRLAGEPLWAGPEGHSLARLVEELREAQLSIARADAAAVIDSLLAAETIRPQFGRHPRLRILGLLEARFERADLLILGGLSEGRWPAEPPADPWLPRGLRRILGLPSPDARIGLQASDFLGLVAGAGTLMLTRSRRREAGPEGPSRFLLKLRLAAGDTLADDGGLPALARALDAPAEVRPAPRPAPSPPPPARPRRLSASVVDMLAADPFSFYARHILGLEPLEPLDGDPASADRGTAVHAILERWLGRREDRVAVTEEVLAALGGGPATALLFRPRVERMLDWVADELARDRQEGWEPIAFEVEGAIDLGGVRLSGKADRVDRHQDGRLRILDYKTGSVPKKARVESGMALQLPALALIAASGALPDVPAVAAASIGLLYAKLRGRADSPGKVMGSDWVWNIAAAEARLREIAHRYLAGDAPFRAKEHPIYAEAYRTYDQLARLAEWLGRDGGDPPRG